MNQLLQKTKSLFDFAFFRKKDFPNIVMVLLDQFRNDARQTHEIFQSLKQRGVLFSQMITYAPYTLASLHATFTGMYGRQNGVDAYTKSLEYDAKGCYSLPQFLHDVGYHTRGYTFSPILFPHNGFDSLKIVPEDQERDILSNHLEELRQGYNQSSPFFAFLHYGEIHHEVVRNVIRKFDNYSLEYFDNAQYFKKQYDEYATKAGDYTDNILKQIDSFDPEGNTLFVVFTDHGSGIADKPGEKAYGIFTYDYTICVWLYLVYPRKLPSNCEISYQVRSIDILPTVMELLGLAPVKRKKSIMGESLIPLIQGDEAGHRIAFSETGGVEGPYPSPDSPNIFAIRDGKWKLIFNKTTNKFELYDIQGDPLENINLYTHYPEQAKCLWLELAKYL